jgi:hypothetical protein
MARQGITRDQVAAVADALVGDGQQPTINAIGSVWAAPGRQTRSTSILCNGVRPARWRRRGPGTAAGADRRHCRRDREGRSEGAGREEQELQQAQAEAAELGPLARRWRPSATSWPSRWPC